MNKGLEQRLLECLDLMEGGLSVSEILSRYPEQADMLRPFLETATQLSQLATNPTIAQKNKSQDAFLAEAVALKTVNREPIFPWMWLRRILFPVAALSLMLILFGMGLFTTSASALPGEPLYNVKRQFEALQLQMVSASDEKLRLIDQFTAERRQEVETLLLTGQTAETQFDGVIERMATETWVVSNIPIEIQDDTIIAGTPQIESLVRVSGLVQNGLFLTDVVEVLKAGTDTELRLEPTPTSTSTPTIAPSSALTATSTASPTHTTIPTETAVPTQTTEPTSTETYTPAPTETPLPTETAVPETTPLPPPTTPPNNNDNTNDNGADNDNENSEDNDNEDNDNEDNDNEDNDNEDNDNEDNDNEDNDNEDNDNEDNDNEDNDNEDNDNEEDDNSNEDNDNENDDNSNDSP